MLKLLTRDFGEMEISDENIISFPDGIFAFEDEHKFVLISPEEVAADVYWLQSVKTSELCFILFEARSLVKDYSPVYPLSELQTINAKSNDNLRYMLIGVIKEDFSKSTVNLKSPIIINEDTKMGMQIICENTDYHIKHPLVQDNA